MCDSLLRDAQIFIFTTVAQNKAGNRRYKAKLFSNKSNTKFTWLLFKPGANRPIFSSNISSENV